MPDLTETQRRTLANLASRERTITDLATEEGVGATTVCMRLKKLMAMGLVRRRYAGRYAYYSAVTR